MEGVSDSLTLSEGVFVFSTPLWIEGSLILRWVAEEFNLGFLVADLLLLGEDEVGGDDGHEEDCHENKARSQDGRMLRPRMKRPVWRGLSDSMSRARR